MVETFYIGYYTVDGEHEFIAFADMGIVATIGLIDPSNVRKAYIGVLVDGTKTRHMHGKGEPRKPVARFFLRYIS